MATPPLEFLNLMPESSARAALLECCGSSVWVERMLAARPFESVEALLAEADRAWLRLGREDRLEAFRAHPRIGEREGTAGSVQGAAWSAGEQSGVLAAPEDVRADVAKANAEYERKFGHIFIVCATGTSAGEILARLRERLGNYPSVELDVAAEEQRKITRLRLEKLIAGHSTKP